MLPLAFIGGAVTGAAGLLAAVMHDSHKTESEYSPLLKTPEHLDAEEVTRQLNIYFFQITSLQLKCGKLLMDAGNLALPSMPLPDDGFFQKAAKALDDGMTGISRRLRQDDLLTLKKDCQKLYGRYRGIFQRANAILRERGHSPVSLKAITFKGQDFSLNNSLENEEWWEDFDALVTRISDVMETSRTIAQRLTEMLEQEGDPAAIDCEQAHG